VFGARAIGVLEPNVTIAIAATFRPRVTDVAELQCQLCT